MRKLLLIALGIFCTFSHASAEELFEDCENVVNKSGYKLLREYLSETNKANDLCQRLSNQEFLYTDDRNVYYCKADKTELSCEEHEEGRWFPNTSVAAKFSGKNGKRYALLKTSMLSHGVFGSGYHAFFLVPKDVNPRGYAIFSFAGAGESNGLYSDGGGICDNMGDNSEAVTSLSKPFEIVNAGQSNPIVRFNQEITSCKSGEILGETLEYTWQDGAFHKTLDNKVAGHKREETARPAADPDKPPKRAEK